MTFVCAVFARIRRLCKSPQYVLASYQGKRRSPRVSAAKCGSTRRNPGSRNSPGEPQVVGYVRADVVDAVRVVQPKHRGEADHEDRHQAAYANGARVPHAVGQVPAEVFAGVAMVLSGSCRCAIIGVPWCLRRLSLFSTFISILMTNNSPQAKHAETDPRHGTPAMAHFFNRLILGDANAADELSGAQHGCPVRFGHFAVWALRLFH